MPITATTAKMLETCRTHIAINGEMDAMGLGSSKDVHIVHKGPLKKGQGKGQRQGQDRNSSSNTPVKTAPSITPQGAPPAQQKMPNAKHVGRLDTGK